MLRHTQGLKTPLPALILFLSRNALSFSALICTYCNSRKGEKVKKGQGWRWLWPDEHNTFLAFSYEGAVPKINEEYLQRIGEEALNRAKALFEDLALDYRPCGKGKGIAGKKKDKRWERRLFFISGSSLNTIIQIEEKPYPLARFSILCSCLSRNSVSLSTCSVPCPPCRWCRRPGPRRRAAVPPRRRCTCR
mgnify:CR=1 FL=1